MIQNFGSKPNNNCKTTTDEVMMMGFLYLISVFILATTTARCAAGAFRPL